MLDARFSECDPREDHERKQADRTDEEKSGYLCPILDRMNARLKIRSLFARVTRSVRAYTLFAPMKIVLVPTARLWGEMV